MAMENPYNEAGLQSLFGYGRAAHERSGGICQLCGCGAGPEVDFDLWRQFTIEHLIGERQGGYLPRIKAAVEVSFAHLPQDQRRTLAARIHDANVVTACQFCNSTTSRDIAPFTMEEAIANLPGDPEKALGALAQKLQVIQDAKRGRAAWKLQSVYRAFRTEIRPALLKRREEEPRLQEPRDLPALDVTATAPTDTR
jgi:hypothetical protein